MTEQRSATATTTRPTRSRGADPRRARGQEVVRGSVTASVATRGDEGLDGSGAVHPQRPDEAAAEDRGPGLGGEVAASRRWSASPTVRSSRRRGWDPAGAGPPPLARPPKASRCRPRAARPLRARLTERGEGVRVVGADGAADGDDQSARAGERARVVQHRAQLVAARWRPARGRRGRRSRVSSWRVPVRVAVSEQRRCTA